MDNHTIQFIEPAFVYVIVNKFTVTFVTMGSSPPEQQGPTRSARSRIMIITRTRCGPGGDRYVSRRRRSLESRAEAAGLRVGREHTLGVTVRSSERLPTTTRSSMSTSRLAQEQRECRNASTSWCSTISTIARYRSSIRIAGSIEAVGRRPVYDRCGVDRTPRIGSAGQSPRSCRHRLIPASSGQIVEAAWRLSSMPI